MIVFGIGINTDINFSNLENSILQEAISCVYQENLDTKSPFILFNNKESNNNRNVKITFTKSRRLIKYMKMI